jgi:hypothetical protein
MLHPGSHGSHQLSQLSGGRLAAQPSKRPLELLGKGSFPSAAVKTHAHLCRNLRKPRLLTVCTVCNLCTAQETYVHVGSVTRRREEPVSCHLPRG